MKALLAASSPPPGPPPIDEYHGPYSLADFGDDPLAVSDPWLNAKNNLKEVEVRPVAISLVLGDLWDNFFEMKKRVHSSDTSVGDKEGGIEMRHVKIFDESDEGDGEMLFLSMWKRSWDSRLKALEFMAIATTENAFAEDELEDRFLEVLDYLAHPRDSWEEMSDIVSDHGSEVFGNVVDFVHNTDDEGMDAAIQALPLVLCLQAEDFATQMSNDLDEFKKKLFLAQGEGKEFLGNENC